MNFRYISAWSIRNPIVPIVFFIGLTIGTQALLVARRGRALSATTVRADNFVE